MKQIDIGGAIHHTDSIHVVVLTGVEESGLPKEFVLYQNYPNPFNPSTRLRFDIPKASRVVLKVYNVLGEEVATLVNGQKQAGRYQLEFNAGATLASGVYFYRIEAGSFTETRKLVLIR